MRVHIEFVTKHLDVDSSQPGAEEGPTGPIVHRWKWHASWVQNVVRQFGFYLQEVWKLRKSISSMQRPWWIDHWCTNCHRPGLIAKRNAIAIVCLRHRWVATSRIDNCWKNRSKKRFSKHIFVHVEDHNINRQDVFTLQRVYLSVLVRIHMSPPGGSMCAQAHIYFAVYDVVIDRNSIRSAWTTIDVLHFYFATRRFFLQTFSKNVIMLYISLCAMAYTWVVLRRHKMRSVLI